MMFNFSEIDMTIVQYILLNQKVHYQEIMQETGLSRKTVANHLTYLADSLKQLNVDLIRKRGDGIYFKGNVDGLLENIQSFEVNDINRTGKLLEILLLANKAMTIQKIADLMFISRNTLQLNLKEARNILAKKSLELKTTSKGLIVLGSEANKRHLLSELLNSYWNMLEVENEHLVFNGLGSEDELFNRQFLNQILNLLKDFLDNEMFEYTDYKIKNFAIHIAIIVNRVRSGHYLKRLKTSSPVEQLTVTSDLVTLINEKFTVVLPKLECQYLNLHLFTLGNELKNTDSSLSTMQGFLKNALVSESYDWVLLKDLSLHLLATIDRLKAGLSIQNPYIGDVKNRFPYSFDRAARLMELVQNQYHITIPEDEIAYVALHFQSYSERKLNDSKVNAIIICTTGLGMSRFLEQRVNRVYQDRINVVAVLSLSQFEQMDINVPLILSTIEIHQKQKGVVMVSPLLEEIDEQKVNKALAVIQNTDTDMHAFTDLLGKQRIFLRGNIKTKKEAITFLGNMMISQNAAREGVVESALAREQISSTRMHSIGTPHAKVEYIIKPCISVLVNPNGLDWNGKTVYVVFFIGLNNSVQNIRKIYRYFSKLIKPEFIKTVIKCSNTDSIFDLITQTLRK